MDKLVAGQVQTETKQTGDCANGFEYNSISPYSFDWYRPN